MVPRQTIPSTTGFNTPAANPWLSVLMPTYNGERFLDKAFDSLEAQQYPAIECVVIDDGSSDATLQVIQAYRNRLQINLLHANHTGNWVANTNRALRAAVAPYVCLLHQDDVWEPDRLRVMHDIIKAYPRLKLYFHASQFIDEEDRVLGSWRCPLPEYPATIASDFLIERLIVQNFIGISAPIFSRHDALAVGGMTESLWYTADWDFWLRLASTGESVYYPRRLSSVRLHHEQQTIMRSGSGEEFCGQLMTVLENHLLNRPPTDEIRTRVEKAARFSVKVNTSLAARIHHKTNLWPLFEELIALGPSGIFRFFRDSRIWERVKPRLSLLL